MENIEKETFVVDSDAKADWCLEKIRKARELQEQNSETAKAILERKKQEVEEWLAEQNAETESTILRMQALLEPYVQEKLKDSKKKSFKLPSGSAGYKKQQPVFSFRGKEIDAAMKKDEFFIALADEIDPLYVKTERSVVWAELKKNLLIADDGRLVTKDGELVSESLSVKVLPDKFFVS